MVAGRCPTSIWQAVRSHSREGYALSQQEQVKGLWLATSRLVFRERWARAAGLGAGLGRTGLARAGVVRVGVTTGMTGEIA
ncbi:hypothetical protein Tco_0337469 [Tanacetum coccineum]